MKRLISLCVLLALLLCLCACDPAVSGQIGTTDTEFTSNGFTLSVPNEYVDLLTIDTTVHENDYGTFFSVHEKASQEAARALFPGENVGGGFLFGIGTVDEDQFHEMMKWGMTGADVFARDEAGNYFIYYHPTDVQLLRVGDYTDADWQLWTDLCDWAAGITVSFPLENRLTPYTRTYSDIDCVLHIIAYADGSARLSAKGSDAIYVPDWCVGLPYVEQLLDDVLFHRVVDGDFDRQDDYISLTVPDFSGDTSFDFFIGEGQQPYIRENIPDVDPIYYMASRDGQTFPAGQVVADWYATSNAP